ncbi:phage minor head protein [Pseudomonas resinovorans]|uniref:Phage minor head protein n=1 Tax=Metapseudomonas resinovorans TaxID=53412 RepID=A0ABT4YAG1_METRE|nr:phage minor head protein [Pseudomonas resinovorans]MDA8485857.1 phage minor head protein [Pseudomonas resinovorans]
MHNSIMYWLKAAYRKTPLAQDANPAAVMRAAMRKLTRRWARHFDDMADELAKRFADKTLKTSDASLYTAFRDLGATVKFTMSQPMRTAYQGVIAENVNLIKSIPRQYLTQVETMVMQSVQRGRDLGTLANDLESRYGVTKRRAALIARDQNNKATSVLTSARQQSLGITHGIWQHSGAGKVPRASHVAADGEEFELAKGMYLDGKWVMPGEEINCRCGWRPVIPGFT